LKYTGPVVQSRRKAATSVAKLQQCQQVERWPPPCNIRWRKRRLFTMKKFLITAVLLAAGSSAFAQSRGGFSVGGSWGNGQSGGSFGVYNDNVPPPPPPPAYGQYGSYDDGYGYDSGYGRNQYYANRPPMPGPGYDWVDGYYDYCGPRVGYQWRPGRWAMRSHGRGQWVAPRYDRNRRGYTNGYWRR
jgi:hypothetical protein